MGNLAKKFGVAAFCVWLLAGCIASAAQTPPGIDFEEGDIVYTGIGPAGASNLGRFQAFLAVTESGGEDAVRLVSVTVEGDPIYTDISYAEQQYAVYVDASEDDYAAEGDRQRVKKAQCGALTSTELGNDFREYRCQSYTFVVRDAG